MELKAKQKDMSHHYWAETAVTAQKHRKQQSIFME